MNNRDVHFIMKLGKEVNDLIFSRLKKHSANHDEQVPLLYDFLLNFTCNLINDISKDDCCESNINAYIKGLTLWINKNKLNLNVVRASYDSKNDSLDIEGVH